LRCWRIGRWLTSGKTYRSIRATAKQLGKHLPKSGGAAGRGVDRKCRARSTKPGIDEIVRRVTRLGSICKAMG